MRELFSEKKFQKVNKEGRSEYFYKKISEKYNCTKGEKKRQGL